MKKLMFCALLILLSLAAKHPARAQQYLEPNYNHCIRLVDGGFGTIGIQNTCNIGISVQWVPYDNGSGGQLDIAPGSTQGTGATNREKSEQGGWNFYICPRNYSAVDGRDRPITEPNVSFHCKRDY
jgi:hypothetical protein